MVWGTIYLEPMWLLSIAVKIITISEWIPAIVTRLSYGLETDGIVVAGERS